MGRWVATYMHVYADDSDQIGSFVPDGGFFNVDSFPRVAGVAALNRSALPTNRGIVAVEDSTGDVVARVSPSFDSIAEAVVAAKELVGGLDAWS